MAPASAAVAAPAASTVDVQSLAKGLGGGQAPKSGSSNVAAAAQSALQAARFVLTGVVVQKTNAQGVALIAVDGKPPRPYRVGSQLSEGVFLHSVSAGKAMLAITADGAPELTLALPQLTSAIAGTAVAARPILATPAQMPAAATPAANPMSALGQRPPRPMANRQREAGAEVQRDLSSAPAQQ